MGCFASTSKHSGENRRRPGNIGEVTVFVPGLRIPKAVDFSQSLGDHLSKNLVERLSALRTRVVVMAGQEGPAITRTKRRSASQHGGSTLGDLIQALDDYLPVLMGLVKEGTPLQRKAQFVWVNQEDEVEETAMFSAWYEVLSVLHLMAALLFSQANLLLLPRTSSDGHQPKVSEVRSAYRLLQAQKRIWRQDDQNSIWRKTWRIKAPPKVCRMGEETVEHIICNCDLAVQCWQSILPQVPTNNYTSLIHWWEKVMEVCDNEKRAEVVTVCWSIWKARNELVWNKKYTRVNVVIAKSKQYLLQWNIAQKLKPRSQYPYFVEGDGKEFWVAPQTDYMKISVDAAIFAEYNASGMGLIARDSTGQIVEARTKCNMGLISANMAEAMAVKEALSWIKGAGWSKVAVETDCLTVVQAIRSKAPLLSPLGHVIQSCRNMLENLNTVSLFFVKRSANMAAHELARRSYSLPDRVFDRISVPIEVKNVLSSDLSL